MSDLMHPKHIVSQEWRPERRSNEFIRRKKNHTCTSCGPASFKKVAFVCAAQARAIKVFPVPGGPYRSTPLGGRTPNFWNRSLCVIGSTMASTSSWICSKPD